MDSFMSIIFTIITTTVLTKKIYVIEQHALSLFSDEATLFIKPHNIYISSLLKGSPRFSAIPDVVSGLCQVTVTDIPATGDMPCSVAITLSWEPTTLNYRATGRIEYTWIE